MHEVDAEEWLIEESYNEIHKDEITVTLVDGVDERRHHVVDRQVTEGETKNSIKRLSVEELRYVCCLPKCCCWNRKLRLAHSTELEESLVV